MYQPRRQRKERLLPIRPMVPGWTDSPRLLSCFVAAPPQPPAGSDRIAAGRAVDVSGEPI